MPVKSATRICAVTLCATLAMPGAVGNAQPLSGRSLAGTWHLASLYDEEANGEEASTFGLTPKGRLVLDDSGHFMLQIVDDLRWGACDRGGATAALDTAAAGTLAYFGKYEIDRGTILFRVEAALSRRWEGSVRLAEFNLADGRLDLVSSALPSLTGAAYSHLAWQRIE
jgi:hypothetical protein